MDLLKPIQDNWAVVTAAPWAFVAFILIGVVAGRFWQNGVVSTLTSRLALKDDRLNEYDRKLGGATPDEAQKKVEDLERRLKALEPRSLSLDQIKKMGAVLYKRPGQIRLTRDMGSPESARIYSQIENVFDQNGWQVMSMSAMGVTKSTSGIVITTRTGDSITDLEICIREALSSADLAFEIRRQPPPSPPPDPPPGFPPMPFTQEPTLDILFTSAAQM